jgi:hypothetical protein
MGHAFEVGVKEVKWAKHGGKCKEASGVFVVVLLEMLHIFEGVWEEYYEKRKQMVGVKSMNIRGENYRFPALPSGIVSSS